MVLFNSITPHILKYIHKFLNIYNSINLYERYMDCSNIISIIAKMKNPKEFDKLAYLVSTGSTVSIILKTIIFVDSLDKGIKLIDYLHNLLLVYIKRDRERIIKTFTLILEYLKDFRYSDIKIRI